jgi:tRNA nucleotidyltransferase/poly(A) polymerase
MEPKATPANIPVSQDVMTIFDALRHGDPNTHVYIVGGAVRDFLYHQFHGRPGTKCEAKDHDLTTNLSEEEILQRLRTPYAVQLGIRVKEKESVDTFGVVFVSVNRGTTVEVAPFRRDIGSGDGRHPKYITYGSIHDDAMRRDLTMNNLYYDFENKVIFDFNPEGQGVEDVKQGVARPVGDPYQRFDEDKLRVLRLVRFFSRFNQGSIAGSLDPQTLAAIEHFKQLNQYSGITPERIQTEFLGGISQSQSTASYLRNMVETDLFQAIFPGLKVETQTLDRLGNSKNPRVIIAWLLRQNQNIGVALNRLKYSNEISDPVDFLVNAMNFGTENAVAMVKNRDRRLLKVGKKRTELTPEDEQRNQQISQETQGDLQELSQVMGQDMMPDQTPVYRMQHLAQYEAPEISGNELMQQGYRGPDIGNRQQELGTQHYAKSFQDYVDARQKPAGSI